MPKPRAAKPAPAPPEPPGKTCEAPECSATFTPKRSTALYCGTTCRQRAARARKAAAVAAEIDHLAETEQHAGTSNAEHGLVKATRLELEKADAINTVDGQIALQLARKLTDPDQAGFAGLAKELRAVLREAIGAPPPAGDEGTGPTAEPEDEVTQARNARAQAREAARLS